MTEPRPETNATSSLPLMSTVLGGLLGVSCAIGVKALTIEGSPVGPGTALGEGLGIPLLLSFPLAFILLIAGLFLRRSRPRLFAFALAMIVGLVVPFIVPLT
jgi:hypothetical protein